MGFEISEALSSALIEATFEDFLDKLFRELERVDRREDVETVLRRHGFKKAADGDEWSGKNGTTAVVTPMPGGREQWVADVQMR